MEVVRVDGKGRILLPKKIREALGIRARQRLRISIVNGRIVLDPLKSVADEYYGIMKIRKWPRDLDKFLVEAIRNWWREST
ncbi:AbrB/MazE/SpoVT family DNA-binding domain-containing protein [Candidatus Geothermarchaeota archaeon]|nr:MAG: AbrB/MazE/SpoVT family DNA-binding domain-containing protein [Candidatus Geothermarchaeota archaeon]